MIFFPLINVKMPTIVGILTLMSKKTSCSAEFEHEKSFITSEAGFNCEWFQFYLFIYLHVFFVFLFFFCILH